MMDRLTSINCTILIPKRQGHRAPQNGAAVPISRLHARAHQEVPATQPAKLHILKAFEVRLEFFIADDQALQSAWALDAFQTLIEAVAQSQVLQSTGQIHILQSLVEVIPKVQIFEARGQVNLFQATIKSSRKGQALQSTG